MMSMKKKKRKLKNNRGFSLTELLVTIVIVSLLSMMIVTGVQTATSTYRKVTDKANAQVLLATCMTMLRNELTTARVIPDAGSTDRKSIRYIGGNGGYEGKIRSGVIASTELTGSSEQEQLYISMNGAERLMVDGITATNELLISFESIEEEDGIITVTGLSVKKNGSDTDLAFLESFVIRTL